MRNVVFGNCVRRADDGGDGFFSLSAQVVSGNKLHEFVCRLHVVLGHDLRECCGLGFRQHGGLFSV